MEETVGRYRLLRKLASGGMADVFLAALTGPEGFEKRAVLKRMKPELAGSAEYRDLFVSEAKVMASFAHPNLVAVLDFGEAEGAYFLVLEHVEGVDLHRVLTVTPALPPPEAVAICAAVLRALQHVHTRVDARGEPLNVVHRDVSPQNILLGHSGEVKLGDFGVARSSARRVRTAPGATRGKLRYMSPEQAAGRPVDPRTDLFAVALVAHEAMTGKSAFDADTEAQLMVAVRDGRVGLAGLRDVAGAALTEVIARGLSPEPSKRFATAAEFEQALVAACPPAAAPAVAARVAQARAALPAEGAEPSRERGAFSRALLGTTPDAT